MVKPRRRSNREDASESLCTLQLYIDQRKDAQQKSHNYHKLRKEVDRMISGAAKDKKAAALKNKLRRYREAEELMVASRDKLCRTTPISVSTEYEMKVVVQLMKDHGWNGSIKIAGDRNKDARRITQVAKRNVIAVVKKSK